MLPVCTSTLKPFVIGSFNSVGVYAPGFYGYTPGEACASFSVGVGGYMVAADAYTCRPSVNSYTYPVLKACEPLAVSPFSMSVADGVTLSGLILSVWVSALVFRWFIAALRGKGEESA